jgi:hypothetical protein
VQTFLSTFHINGYTLKTKYRNIVIFTCFLPPSLLAIETVQNDFIFIFIYKLISISGEILARGKKKARSPVSGRPFEVQSAKLGYPFRAMVEPKDLNLRTKHF